MPEICGGLLEVLNEGKAGGMVLGNPEPGSHGLWFSPERAREILHGSYHPRAGVDEAWGIFRNPVPPPWSDRTNPSRFAEDLCDSLRDVGVNLLYNRYSKKTWADLSETEVADEVGRLLIRMDDPAYLKECNPITRHVVLRRRTELEDRGLLKRIGVRIHPRIDRGAQDYSSLDGDYIPLVGLDDGSALMVSSQLEEANALAEEFCKLLGQREKGAGFIKSIMAQRLCSSVAAGLITARKILDQGQLGIDPEELEGARGDESERLSDNEAELLEADDQDTDKRDTIFTHMGLDEKACLEGIVRLLEPSVEKQEDPKLQATRFLLLKHRLQTDGGQKHQTWAKLGCIVFSQYYDTALWVARALADTGELSESPIALYAGAGKSKMFQDGKWRECDRDDIKKGVEAGEIRLVIATDAASEGLDLQTLGCLINIDLPWNPSRLEQRIGRIKRIGQRRSHVDLCNLVYEKTRDMAVYEALSRRMENNVSILGGLPDTLWDDWIEDKKDFEDKIDGYITAMDQAKNAFDLATEDDYDVSDFWETQSKVIAREDVLGRLRVGWRDSV